MTPADTPQIQIPTDLLPADGRFGCGPSKVRPEAVAALAEAAPDYLGTSHRQARVLFEVGALRNGLAELLAAPDGYEVLLGNGGTTSFWDAATFGLIDRRSQHLRFGEFSSKFAEAAAAAPHLQEPSFLFADPGTHPMPVADPEVDAYCLTHNETSTGVAMPLERPPGPTASCWSTPPRRPAACASTPTRSTSTTSPRRSASPATAACGWPSCRRPRWSASSRSPRPTAGSRPRST